MRSEFQQKADFFAGMYWDTLCELYPALVKFDVPKIKLCNRKTVTAGCCYQLDSIIDLAFKFFDKFEDRMILEILPHELAHQADYNLFGQSEKKCGHGKKWCEIMVKLGLPANKYHYLKI
jgi:predicted SprT family Zn-dependent metalloprotease